MDAKGRDLGDDNDDDDLQVRGGDQRYEEGDQTMMMIMV